MQTRVTVAVCVSLSGAGVVALAVYTIVKYRLRRKRLDAQDTLPRPFEVIVPATTMTNTSMITHDLTSIPVLDISPRTYSRSGGRGESDTRAEEGPTRIEPLRAGSAHTPTATTPSQSRSSRSRNICIQPYRSDTSLLYNHARPSYRVPPYSRTHPHTPIPPDSQPQSDSRVQPGQSSLSVSTGTLPPRAAGDPASLSISAQERRSAKHALWLSRSASELYRASSSVPRYRTPESGSHGSPGGARELHGETFARPTNHLRQWHSASPVVRVRRATSDSEEDPGGTFIFQHQDADVMQELPPPYHKLVGSGMEV